MRLVLPATAALIALAALLGPLLSDTQQGFTFRRDTLVSHPDQIRALNARYTGADSQGRLFYLSAAEASQDTPTAPTIRLKDLSAKMELDRGGEARVYAPGGRYAVPERMIYIENGMEFVTSTGYRLTTRTAQVDLDRHVARSEAPVMGLSPLGEFQAGGFALYADQRIAQLTGGVRMRVDPIAVETVAQNMERSE